MQITPLPKDDTDLAVMLRRHCERMETNLAPRRTLWMLAWYYLNGYRRFNVYDPQSQRIIAHQLDEDGNLEYQSQELLYYINQVAGRIQGMDLRPWVESPGKALGDMRQRALNQLILDASVGDHEVAKAKEEFAYTYACLGFAGLQGHLSDHPTIGLVGGLETIHPRELFPFPAVEHDQTKNRGLVRQRMVPVEELRERFGPKVSRSLDKMEWYSQLHDDPWLDIDQGSNEVGGLSSSRTPWQHGYDAGKNRDDSIMRVAKVRELWLYGPGGTTVEYALACGDTTLHREDLRGLEVYCPIGWARAFNNGTFHGAGMFEVMYSQHRQLEMMSKALFTNIRDIDRYGVVVLPQGQMNQNQVLKDVGKGLRAMFWDPDVVGEGFRPFAISPHNAGDAPGKVAAFAREGLQLLNPVRDLAEEKGRIDGAPALARLEEDLQQKFTTITSGVQKVFGDCYRSLAQKISNKIVTAKRTVPVSNLTLDLAGAVINFEDGSVSFESNPVPSVNRLKFTVRDVSPKSQTARKQEAYQLWEGGIETDPMNFRLFALREGLDFAIYLDDIKGAYESSVRSILSLYNNGEEPGPVMMTPYTVDGELFARLLTGFMKGPHMQVASDEVVAEFFRIREWTITTALGMVLPNAVPNPDDLAMMAEQGLSEAGPAMMNGSGPPLPPGPTNQGAPPQGPPPTQGP